MRNILLLLLLLGSLPSFARDAVQDGAHLLTPETVAQLQKIDAELSRATGKNLLVVTENDVAVTPRERARDLFRRENLNGMLILVLPDKRQLGLVPGRSTEQLFPGARLSEIRESMLTRIRRGDFDSGVLQGAEAVRTTLLAAERPPASSLAPTPKGPSFLGWLPLLLLGFLGYLGYRFFSRKRDYYAPPGQPGLGYGYGQPAYGGPGAGWGGGLFGNLAAGVGGALLGNTIYDAVTHRGHGESTATAAPDSPSWTDSDAGTAGGGDFGGWGSDAGSMGGGDFGGGGSDW